MAEVEAFFEFRGKKSDSFEYSKPKFKPKGNGGRDKDIPKVNGKTQTIQRAKPDKL